MGRVGRVDCTASRMLPSVIGEPVALVLLAATLIVGENEETERFSLPDFLSAVRAPITRVARNWGLAGAISWDSELLLKEVLDAGRGRSKIIFDPFDARNVLRSNP